MGILRPRDVVTPDFENLLAPRQSDVLGPVEDCDLPDPFPGVQQAGACPSDDRPMHANPLPARPIGPYRPYWRESTFLRAVGLQCAQCQAALDDWCHQQGTPAVLEVGGSRLQIPADLASRTGPCSIETQVCRCAPWCPMLPMELELIPWSATLSTTWLALCPRRRVHLSTRYFRAGHRFLDLLTEGLVHHAGVSVPGSVAS